MSRAGDGLLMSPHGSADTALDPGLTQRERRERGENARCEMQFVLLWSEREGEPFIIIRMPKYPLALTLMTHKGSHLLPIALSHTLLLETYYNFSYKLTGQWHRTVKMMLIKTFH